VSDLLVVLDDVPQVITTAVVRFADAYGVMSEIDIAVVAEEFWHFATTVEEHTAQGNV